MQNHGQKLLKKRSLKSRLLSWLTRGAMQRCLWHKMRVGHWPNLKNPKTLNEHLLSRIFKEGFRAPAYIDKALAKEKVAQLLGPEYVPQRYLLTTNPALPWDDLPEKFVISATHGSGMTLVVGNKSLLDKTETEKVMQSWLDHDFAKHTGQPIYEDIVPRLLVEENLSSPQGTPPADYKFLCFGGEPKFIQLDVGRYDKHTRINYDTTWQVMPYQSNEVPQAEEQPKPKTLDHMLQVARKLSQGFDFVRVDLYEVGDRVVFGEWTFLPAGGSEPYQPHAYDIMLGEEVAKAKIKLKGKRRGIDIPLDTAE